MLILTHLPWMDLIDHAKDIVLQDDEKLEKNKAYYRKLGLEPNPDKANLEKMYQRLQWESQRLSYFQELLLRLDRVEYLYLIHQLETSMKSESSKKCKNIDNWSFTIVKQNAEIRTFFTPINK
ncbi:MAG: hypothetical protein SFY32_14105 [Bacteroidota bacterium]|nr:hypothetical protein [Bacteroidota bacterium]